MGKHDLGFYWIKRHGFKGLGLIYGKIEDQVWEPAQYYGNDHWERLGCNDDEILTGQLTVDEDIKENYDIDWDHPIKK